MTETGLDCAHALMAAAPEDDGAARLGFYHCLADTLLFLLLSEEPEGDQLAPQVFQVEDVRYALAFDTEERLADFTGAPAPYALLPGRVLAGMLAASGAGLGLNLDVASSAILLPPEALGWLAETLGQGGVAEVCARPEKITAPEAVSEVLLDALAAKLARVQGLASHACLVEARYAGGNTGQALFFIGALPGADAVLTRAVSEALTFLGGAAVTLDVGFAGVGSALAERLERVGLRFDLPQAEVEKPRAAPGSDPDNPPKLR